MTIPTPEELNAGNYAISHVEMLALITAASERLGELIKVRCTPPDLRCSIAIGELNLPQNATTANIIVEELIDKLATQGWSVMTHWKTDAQHGKHADWLFIQPNRGPTIKNPRNINLKSKP